MAFRDLAAEVAGTSERYGAAERVDLAATDRWRESWEGPINEDPNEEVDDSSPMARVLTLLDRTVTGVAGMPESGLREEGWDPANVRTRLLGWPVSRYNPSTQAIDTHVQHEQHCSGQPAGG